jgi:2-desacetyl-2-hydroxyethyl bacteriochlorophyllide A dehydrogenase
MKAAVFHPSTGLIIRRVKMPQVGKKEVLIKLKAAGICASDILYMEGFLTYSKVPIIPGHEGSGVIEEVGEGVTNVGRGDRVVVHYVTACGECVYCLIGKENLCKSARLVGFDLNGTFAEYVAVPEYNVVKLPDNISYEYGAISGCAVVTPYHAAKIGGVSKGESVGIIGLGGVGINAVQIAKKFGATKVIGVDVSNFKLRVAKEYGADEVINFAEANITELIRSIIENGVDIMFDFVGKEETITKAIETVKRGGRVVLVGLINKPILLPVPELLYHEKQLLTSIDHTRKDLVEVLDMISKGEIDLSHSITHFTSLENLKDAINTFKTRKEDVIRIVIKF